MEPDNLSIALSEEIARFGHKNNLLVIMEGFYETDIYGQMFERLAQLFSPNVASYYYALSFDETLKRHQTRAKKNEFTAEDMKRWWLEKDVLGWEKEVLLTDNVSLEMAKESVCLVIDQMP